MMAVTDEGRTARRPASPEAAAEPSARMPRTRYCGRVRSISDQGEFDPLGQPRRDPSVGPDARRVTDRSRRGHDGMRKSHFDHHTVRVSNYNSREVHSGSSWRRKRAQRCSSSTSPMAPQQSRGHGGNAGSPDSKHDASGRNPSPATRRPGGSPARGDSRPGRRRTDRWAPRPARPGWPRPEGSGGRPPPRPRRRLDARPGGGRLRHEGPPPHRR